MICYDFENTKKLEEFGIKNPLKNGELKNMKKKVEKTIKIADGQHTGVITGVEYRDEPFEYVDIQIEEDKDKITLKCGVPFSITENTSLGGILQRFGAKIEVNKEIEVNDFLKENTKVTFATVTEVTNKGKFARILPETLKPQ